MILKSILPAVMASARRAANEQELDRDQRRTDTLSSIAATALAVLVVGLIAVLLGMT
jgi:uncharacterized membrane protein YidH (DUF202 family)